MIVLSSTVAQTLQPGQALTFNDVILHSGCGECHRGGSGSVKLRANGIYEAAFSANVSSATAATPVQLSLAIGGEPLPETTMISTPAAADAFNNISTQTAIKNTCGDYDRVTVVNTGTAPVTVGANPVLFIKRLS
ncbi:MAG: hypothetical protein [Chaetfec virus UA24_144]|nr:MAG: hypothetical protein [Chaetfec virus UA24_144]